MTRTQAQKRNHWIFKTRGSLHLLAGVPEDILEHCRYSHTQLVDMVIAIQDAIYECSYTYTTCNHCKLSLTGRRHQSRNSQHCYICDVCGSKCNSYDGTRQSRMKIPLHEARSKMRKISPELFI
jgi:transposase-like protein